MGLVAAAVPVFDALAPVRLLPFSPIIALLCSAAPAEDPGLLQCFFASPGSVAPAVLLSVLPALDSRSGISRSDSHIQAAAMKRKAGPNTIKINAFFKPVASSSQPTEIVSEADVQVTNPSPVNASDQDMPDVVNVAEQAEVITTPYQRDPGF
ncbi:uncharacterized protein [Triticum aestivum]|uniref:uncharacterized protein n=1 Tax=Triticum aestivum TaxID=4565 RepID=UPI001D009F23|nr:uncharacterized protein LOC123055927 [Triticum aestivum]